MAEAPQPLHAPKALSDQALAWIVRLNSGEAGDRERAAFHEWRQRSADHEAAAREAETLWEDLAQLEGGPGSGRVRPGRSKARPSRRAVLAGVLGAGVAGAGTWVVGERLLTTADHGTGIGEVRRVELPDGSRVTLNAMTEIDIDFGPDRRRVVLLRGQCFFEVGNDGQRPFVVAAGDVQLKALGTAFDVDTSLPGGAVAVAVTEHAVRIAPAEGGEALVVAEGERAVVAPGGGRRDLRRQSADVTKAWRSGFYIAEDRRLDEVLAALNAYRSGWIVARGDAVRSLRVNAVLDLSAPDQSLDALAEGLPVDVWRLSPYLTVVSAS